MGDSRWCKKCKAVFSGSTCAGGHANFMYTNKIPPAAAAPRPASAPALAERPSLALAAAAPQPALPAAPPPTTVAPVPTVAAAAPPPVPEFALPVPAFAAPVAPAAPVQHVEAQRADRLAKLAAVSNTTAPLPEPESEPEPRPEPPTPAAAPWEQVKAQLVASMKWRPPTQPELNNANDILSGQVIHHLKYKIHHLNTNFIVLNSNRQVIWVAFLKNCGWGVHSAHTVDFM